LPTYKDEERISGDKTIFSLSIPLSFDKNHSHTASRLWGTFRTTQFFKIVQPIFPMWALSPEIVGNLFSLLIAINTPLDAEFHADDKYHL